MEPEPEPEPPEPVHFARSRSRRTVLLGAGAGAGAGADQKCYGSASLLLAQDYCRERVAICLFAEPELHELRLADQKMVPTEHFFFSKFLYVLVC